MTFFLLLLFFFLDYVRPTSYVPGLTALHLNSIIPIVAVLGALATRRERRPVEGEPSNDLLIASFIGLIALSAAFADITERVFTIFTTVIGYAAVYWVLTQQVTSLDRLKTVMKTLLLVHLVVAALNPLLFTDPDARIYVTSGAFLGDGNDFALSLNIAIPLCLFLMSEATTVRHRAFWALGLAVCVTCVVLTKSRGGTIALACVGLYYWAKSDRKVLSAILVAVVLAAIMIYAPPTYFERMSTIADPQEGSAQGRIQAWGAAIGMAAAYPLTGVGAGHFGLVHGKTAHSIYFLVLGELGFPGLIVLLLILAKNLTANRRQLRALGDDPSAATERRMLAALSAATIAFATGGAFLSATYYPHMWVLAGLNTAARRLVAERSRSAAPARAAVSTRVVPYAISPEWKSARAGHGLHLPTTAPHGK